jgi:hypothetical protein
MVACGLGTALIYSSFRDTGQQEIPAINFLGFLYIYIYISTVGFQHTLLLLSVNIVLTIQNRKLRVIICN